MRNLWADIMTKTNIDLGEVTSVGVSASATVAAGTNQSTTVGFDTATKYLFHAALDLNILNISSAYSVKEWLITNKHYRETGSVSKVATNNVEVGCKSFFAGGESFEIKACKKIQFVSGRQIKVRLNKNQPVGSLADDQSSVMELLSNGICKIKNCANIKIYVSNDASGQNNAGSHGNAIWAFVNNHSGNGASKKKCLEVSKTGGVPTVSFYGEALKLNADSGANILNKVLVGKDNVNWVDCMTVDAFGAKIVKAIDAKDVGVRIIGSAAVNA